MKYIKKIIFNANEFNIDLNYAKLNNDNRFINKMYLKVIIMKYHLMCQMQRQLTLKVTKL